MSGRWPRRGSEPNERWLLTRYRYFLLNSAGIPKKSGFLKPAFHAGIFLGFSSFRDLGVSAFATIAICAARVRYLESEFLAELLN